MVIFLTNNHLTTALTWHCCCHGLCELRGTNRANGAMQVTRTL